MDFCKFISLRELSNRDSYKPINSFEKITDSIVGVISCVFLVPIPFSNVLSWESIALLINTKRDGPSEFDAGTRDLKSGDMVLWRLWKEQFPVLVRILSPLVPQNPLERILFIAIRWNEASRPLLPS
jgi:hypothetical protein